MTSEAKPKKRFHIKTLLIILLIMFGCYAAGFIDILIKQFNPTLDIAPSWLAPISPVVVLPAEPTGLHIGNFQITNTILATLLADVILLLMAFAAWRFYRRGGETPKGIVNILESLVEFMWNNVLGSAGKWAKRIFPVVATIFLLIFVANIVKLVPGFESIGHLKQVHEGTGYAPVALFRIGDFTLWTIDKGQPVEVEAAEEHAAATDEHAAAPEEHAVGAAPCTACEVVPYFRGTATDINFPFALAILTVLATQIYGVWAQGPKYFEKFFQVKRLVTGGPFGIIDFAVGLLEIILEFAKILSFGFRLFGNVFAGALLLSILGALVAVGVPPILYILEVFFGIIQAYVFFLLATIFLSGATIAHGHEEAH